MTLRLHRELWFFGSAACFASACASEPVLKPAAAPVSSRYEANEATATQENVHLAVEPGWSGDAFIEQEVTPLRITLSNRSDAEVHVRYSDFWLVDERGARSAALPLVSTSGVVASKTIPSGFDSSRFEPPESQAFRYAPYYSSIDPTLEVYEGTFNRDERYSSNYGPDAWETTLPTKDMVKAALPEGVLMPGGYVSGYLYFQKIDKDADRIWLRTALPTSGDAEPNRIEFELPFVVH